MTMPDQQPVTSLNDHVMEEIRVLLTRRRMSQRQLAAKLGVSPAWVNYRLTGVQTLDLNDLSRIADALGVPVLKLLPSEDLAHTLRNLHPAEKARSEPVSPDRPPRQPKRHRTRPAGTTPKSATRRPVMLPRPVFA